MARYTKSYTGEKRTKHLGVQLTPSERALLKKAAHEAGASLSQYVRELSLRRTTTPSVVAATRRNPEARALMHELNAIGNNLNQLTRLANTEKMAPQLRELQGTTDLLKAAMARVLGL